MGFENLTRQQCVTITVLGVAGIFCCGSAVVNKKFGFISRVGYDRELISGEPAVLFGIVFGVFFLGMVLVGVAGYLYQLRK